MSGDNTSVRHGIANSSQDDLSSSTIEIHNLTNYPLILAPKSSDCTGHSDGPATDNGSDNDISTH